jgi:rhamnosyltransferase
VEYSVDILLAVYNGKKYIDNQIQSIINQSHKYWNLFILDDCSPDGTYEYLIKNYSCFEKIFINRNNKNSGVIKTFEQLLNYSKSGFFTFCDQDDVWDRNKLSLLLTSA